MHAADQRADAGAFAGAHVAGLVILHLALRILRDDGGIFEVELLLLLGIFHRVQRLVSGISSVNATTRKPTAGMACGAAACGAAACGAAAVLRCSPAALSRS